MKSRKFLGFRLLVLLSVVLCCGCDDMSKLIEPGAKFRERYGLSAPPGQAGDKKNQQTKKLEELRNPKSLKGTKKTSVIRKKIAQSVPVKVYVAEGCDYCDDVEAFLKNRGIIYKKVNIYDKGILEKLGKEPDVSTLPVVKIGSQVVSGYRPNEILRKLREQGYEGVEESHRF